MRWQACFRLRWTTYPAQRGSGAIVQSRQRNILPAGIWVLGFVSLLMDISSEMIHVLLPLFLVTSLGASALMIGLLWEGSGTRAMSHLGAEFSGTAMVLLIPTGAKPPAPVLPPNM